MKFQTAIYSDGAVIEDMLTMKEQGLVTGFTTNPSLMKKAGITNYLAFAKEALAKLGDLPISFEVFGDDFDTMEQEALKISSLGDSVFVKIPITNTKGESSGPLIQKLTKKGIKVNVTAIMTIPQVKEAVAAVENQTEAIISVFAGRIADTGIDPIPTMKEALAICNEKPNTKLLWASCREVFNIIEADRLQVPIITVPPAILTKLKKMYHLDLNELSLQTVKTFNQDIKDLGFSILD